MRRTFAGRGKRPLPKSGPLRGQCGLRLVCCETELRCTQHPKQGKETDPVTQVDGRPTLDYLPFKNGPFSLKKLLAYASRASGVWGGEASAQGAIPAAHPASGAYLQYVVRLRVLGSDKNKLIHLRSTKKRGLTRRASMHLR